MDYIVERFIVMDQQYNNNDNKKKMTLIISYNTNSNIWSRIVFLIHDFQKGPRLNKVTYKNKIKYKRNVEKTKMKLQPMYDIKISKVYI